MADFTKGPWAVHPIQRLAVHQPEYECWIPQTEADARLIAAAPDLYEACEEALATFEEMQTNKCSQMLVDGMIVKLWAALKKARGG